SEFIARTSGSVRISFMDRGARTIPPAQEAGPANEAGRGSANTLRTKPPRRASSATSLLCSMARPHDKAPGQPGGQWFPTTHWSGILAAGHAESPGANGALEQMCRTYWYPLYAYVRHQGHSPEDAQDLTQEFFARFLENKRLSRADPARGRFRSFM